jgi:hypothetical protein
MNWNEMIFSLNGPAVANKCIHQNMPNPELWVMKQAKQ